MIQIGDFAGNVLDRLLQDVCLAMKKFQFGKRFVIIVG
jgi:hypothetical protein